MDRPGPRSSVLGVASCWLTAMAVAISPSSALAAPTDVAPPPTAGPQPAPDEAVAPSSDATSVAPRGHSDPPTQTPEDTWGEEDAVPEATDAPPAAAPVPTAAAAAAADPGVADPAVADPETAELRRQNDSAERMVTAGFVVGGIGLGSAVILSGGALITAAWADARADDVQGEDPILLANESELRGRADRRYRFAWISGIVTGSITVSGAILLGVGITRRNRTRDALADKTRKPTARVDGLVPWGDRATGGVVLHGRF